MRSLVAILIIVAILAGGWSGGWFWLAGWIDENADSVLAEMARRGIDVDCSGRRVSGFPFAMRVACAETNVAERASGTQARLGTVTGGASLFAPMTAQIDMSSPAQVQSPYLETPAEMRWREAAIDIGIGANGPRDVSFDAAEFATELALAGLPDPAVTAAHAAGTLAPSAEGGTDASVTFVDLELSADGAAFPPVSGNASGHLSVPPRALLAGRAGLAAPISARAIDVTVESGGAKFNGEGTLSIDADGVLDGVVTLRVTGADALPDVIAGLPPQMQNLGNAFVATLFAFGRPTTLDGEPASELVLPIENGEVALGLFTFPLPRVPL